MEPFVSRRQFVGGLAGTVGGIWLAANAREVLAAATHAANVAALSESGAQLPRFEVLSPADARDLEAATAQIVPTDDTPGAREARVVYFIDKSLASYAKDQRPQFTKLAAALRSRAQKLGSPSFAALNNANQHRVLVQLEKDEGELFETLRSATIVGMLANPSYGGNYNKLGWKWIGFDDRFSWAAPYGWYDRDGR